MHKARPIAATNAIEATAFVLVFAREFEECEVEALLSLEQSLKDSLPSFLKTNAVTLNVTDNAPAEHSQKLSGVLLQKFQGNGKPEWALRASENRIIVNCLKYDNWDNVWPKARQFLLRAAQCVASDTNGVLQAIFQVIDKFIYDERPATYSIGDVFNPDSEFLTPRVKKAGEMWHIFQGWFEQNGFKADEIDAILHVAKLSSSNISEKLIATIDHTIQANFIKPLGVSNFIGVGITENGSEFANTLFKELHDKNVKMLRDVLSHEQQIAIGLTP